MKRSTILCISLMLTFVWVGFLAAISFMEAPVKFTAPSLTLAVGLDVGRHVFAALNKVEWVFILVSTILMMAGKPGIWVKLVFSVIFIILSVQTFYLLPALDVRALVYINGGTPPASNLHFVYVAIETIKLTGLITFGCLQVAAFKDALKGELLHKEKAPTHETVNF